MWKRIVRWLLLTAAAAFVSGLGVQLAKPAFPESWSDTVTTGLAALRLVVGVSLVLALFAHMVDRLFPDRTNPLVMDARFWLRAVFVAGVMNFLVFVLVAAAIGGDALNGYAQHGHYFLRNRSVVTEVSPWVFTYSRLHAISVNITHLLAILAAWMLYWEDKGHDST